MLYRSILLNEYTFEVFTQRPNFEVLELTQVHSAKVINVDKLQDKAIKVEADGFVFTLNSIATCAVAIKTADCLPILLLGKKNAALIHAGWQGLHKGIITCPEISNIEPQRAYIGPYIHGSDYEVSKDFTKNFPSSDAFKLISDKLYFDLAQEASNQIKSEYNIKADTSIAANTFSEVKLNSWRRDKSKQRNWNIFRKII